MAVSTFKLNDDYQLALSKANTELAIRSITLKKQDTDVKNLNALISTSRRIECLCQQHGDMKCNLDLMMWLHKNISLHKERCGATDKFKAACRYELSLIEAKIKHLVNQFGGNVLPMTRVLYSS